MIRNKFLLVCILLLGFGAAVYSNSDRKVIVSLNPLALIDGRIAGTVEFKLNSHLGFFIYPSYFNPRTVSFSQSLSFPRYKVDQRHRGFALLSI